MACEPVVFENVSEEVFNCVKAKLSSLGYRLEGPSGTIHGPMNIAIEYEWRGGDSTLYTLVKSKNMLISCNRIYNEIDKALKDCDA
jgi:hypothetical protein